MEGLNFRKGTAVEVNLDKENLHDAWFPATVIEEVGFNSFLVEFGSSRNNYENGLTTGIVDSFHIRSPPPNLEVKKFQILESVDAFCNSSWRDGFITKILTDGRYNIFLKHADEERQFSQSEIRPRQYLKNGTWISYCRVFRLLSAAFFVLEILLIDNSLALSFGTDMHAYYIDAHANLNLTERFT